MRSEASGPDHVAADAVEIISGSRAAPVFLTCEHASQRLPEGWCWPAADRRLVDTHWAYDLGARELVLELAGALDASAVLARFTRLLVDPNRPEQHPDAFRALADGEPVLLNAGLDEAEKARRLAGYHRPFHNAVDATLRAVDAPVLLSVHSFTPLYQGEKRDVELGVLFNHDEADALALGRVLEQHFAQVAYNEPWSGRLGLIYSAERHAEQHGRLALELEVRQDRAVDPAYRAALVAVLAEFFRVRGARGAAG
jgi:predicted N-formylglutamate amidohydrolase